MFQTREESSTREHAAINFLSRIGSEYERTEQVQSPERVSVVSHPNSIKDTHQSNSFRENAAIGFLSNLSKTDSTSVEPLAIPIESKLSKAEEEWRSSTIGTGRSKSLGQR
jgi:hypothetical protein